MKIIAVAVVVGIAPMLLAFIAGFFGLVISLGWTAYIAWFMAALVVGVIVSALRQ